MTDRAHLTSTRGNASANPNPSVSLYRRPPSTAATRPRPLCPRHDPRELGRRADGEHAMTLATQTPTSAVHPAPEGLSGGPNLQPRSRGHRARPPRHLVTRCLRCSSCARASDRWMSEACSASWSPVRSAFAGMRSSGPTPARRLLRTTPESTRRGRADARFPGRKQACTSRPPGHVRVVRPASGRYRVRLSSGGSAQTAKNRGAIRSIVPLVRIVHPPTKRSIARRSSPESSMRPFDSQ
jgi:hypothetical protein